MQTADQPLHVLLRRPFDDLILTPVLTAGELATAKAAYPGLAGNEDLIRLPELFAAVNLLTDRYRHHRADQPAGVAVAKAAIDWQRAGMPPGSIDEPALRALTRLTFQEIAPNRALDDEAFERGLAWSTQEVAAFAALVRRDRVGTDEVQRFRAFDAVVSWASANEPPLAQQTWDFVLSEVGDRDRIGVGLAAFQASEWVTAEKAFQRASESADSFVAAPAGLLLGGLRFVQARAEEAVVAFDQVVSRFGESTDPALAPAVAAALVTKGEVLCLKGPSEQAVVVFDQVVSRFGGSADPALAQPVAAALVTKGDVLGLMGRAEEAVVAFDQVVSRFGESADPALTEQIAAALFSRGLELAGLGRAEEAVAAFDQVVSRFGGSAEPPLAEPVARALYRKGVELDRLGRAEEAEAAFDQVVSRFGGSAEPALNEVAAGAFLYGLVVLGQTRCPEEEDGSP